MSRPETKVTYLASAEDYFGSSEPTEAQIEEVLEKIRVTPIVYGYAFFNPSATTLEECSPMPKGSPIGANVIQVRYKNRQFWGLICLRYD